MLSTLALALAPAPLPEIDRDAAARAFAEMALVAREDGGALWGVDLDGPMLFVERETRAAVANRPIEGWTEEEGVWTGELSAAITPANTAVELAGGRWTMVLWPLPAARVERARLLAHESFHRVQPELGLALANAVCGHLEREEPRVWLRLELRALAAALVAEERPPLRAIEDAALFRAMRWSAAPGAEEAERALETNEGLAEYTGQALRGTQAEETRRELARTLDTDAGLARGFAYRTGPAWGLLLDEVAPAWRSRVGSSVDFAGLALAAAALELPGDGRELAARERASVYDGDALAAEEAARARKAADHAAAMRALFAPERCLELPLEGARYSFDPHGMTAVDGLGTVCSPLTVAAPWGALECPGRALLSPDFARAIVPAAGELAARDGTVEGAGWTLELEDGWRIAEREGGGWTLVGG